MARGCDVEFSMTDTNDSIKRQAGFTIVELLIVVIVIAILASISAVAYASIQSRAKNASLQANIKNIQQKIEQYRVINSTYPATQSQVMTSGSWAGGSVAYTDANCPDTFVDYLGETHTIKTGEWVPGIDMVLPQSNGERRGSWWGCYMYQSDGADYVLSAWNMVSNGPQTDTLYRRIGFREMGNFFHVYYCNHGNIGGNRDGTYDVNEDFYKFSYTVSSLRNCNEMPPAGA